MRVITGFARGRKLNTLAGDSITRPTTDSTKEALFSTIQFEIEGKKVLDLFAGCGQLGIEALSRGARFCTFVENNRQAYNVVEQNIEHCKMQDMCTLVLSDAKAFLSRKDNFDIAFLDPPYEQNLVNECLPLLVKNMSEDGVIVCETARNEELEQSVGEWSISKTKNYGKSKLTYYRKDA